METLEQVKESRDQLRAEVERLKKQIKDDNRSYGCELRDPYGTIWEQATKDHARAERAEAEVNRLRAGIAECLNTNGHLADGENCTLIGLKRCLHDPTVHWCEHAAKRSLALDQAQADLAAERARLRQIALDACRSAKITPIVWYPKRYAIDPNDFGIINEQQVEACAQAIDAAMKEETK